MAAFLRRLLSEEDLFLALHLLCCPLSFVCFFCLCLYFFIFLFFYLPVSYMFLSLRRCPLLATFLSVSFYLFYFPVFCLRLCSSRFRLGWFGLVWFRLSCGVGWIRSEINNLNNNPNIIYFHHPFNNSSCKYC